MHVTWVESQKFVSSTATSAGMVSPAVAASLNSYLYARNIPSAPSAVAVAIAMRFLFINSIAMQTMRMLPVMNRIVS